MIHFYLFHKQNMLLISDLAKDKIKVKYGPIFEIVNSVKDKSSLEIVKPKITRQYPKCEVVEDFYLRKVFSEETRKKLAQAKLGKARPDWVRDKISSKMKGKSNFEGKKHRRDSRIKTALSMMDNNCIDGHKFIYNPTTNQEKRVKDIIKLPPGFRLGRNPDAVENFNTLRSSY